MPQKISMYIPDEMYEGLKKAADSDRRDFSKLVRMWIKAGLKSYGIRVTDQMPGKGKAK